MNIAHIVPHSVIFPLASHNGRYDWVRQLALLQVQQGHTVTIYSNPASTLEEIDSQGINGASNDKKQNNIETFRLAFSQNHDVYHSHFDNLHYEVAYETKKPVIFTQHWWPTEQTISLATQYEPSNVWAVPPTQYMQSFDSTVGIHTKGHIYHGIDLSAFQTTSHEKNGRLLFVGRISPEKNLDIALAVAKKAGASLDIVGKIAPKNQAYWESLQLLIDGDRIRYLGQKNQAELVELYSSALGTLCPFEPTEAFGLVAIESQACGTPTIMKRGGSRGELIEENKTGFLCESEEEYVEAIHALTTLKADDCIRFAQKFDIHTMAQSYEQLYTELIEQL